MRALSGSLDLAELERAVDVRPFQVCFLQSIRDVVGDVGGCKELIFNVIECMDLVLLNLGLYMTRL